MKFLSHYVKAGKTIDIVINLHNVEANECPNLYCPFLDINQAASTETFNRVLYAALNARAFSTGAIGTYWGTGTLPSRLSGWCWNTFGSADLAYEVNDRFPARRLPLPRLQQMGGILAGQVRAFLNENEGKVWHFTALEALFKVGIGLPARSPDVDQN